MSLEVNIVRIEINRYKIVNNLNWLALYLLINIVAIYPKKPLVSKAIDKNETEINKTRIFKGFKLESDVNIWMNSRLSNKGKISKIKAMIEIGIKNDSIFLPLILIVGQKRMHKNIPIIPIIHKISTLNIRITDVYYIPMKLYYNIISMIVLTKK